MSTTTSDGDRLWVEVGAELEGVNEIIDRYEREVRRLVREGAPRRHIEIELEQLDNQRRRRWTIIQHRYPVEGIREDEKREIKVEGDP